MLAAEATHRDHAIVEKVIAELKNGPLAHLPSGQMNANAAWLVLAAISFNLTRAAGTLASRFHARATTATIRAQLIASVHAGGDPRLVCDLFGVTIETAQHYSATINHPDLDDFTTEPASSRTHTPP